ncbi:NADH dehydrogenase [ubiquinone] 1 alpha subcomplex subunit 1 [Gracilariopsis chorda]|uniref:NADH dehydrogenase [ubiquinone] 1 alpha subcomplex subunit 1 n=1 Tax=Gracilariopsis chorda TaxID=448386 RepID=A0A2V3IYG4_9FLOR|nr:NADH dehydrogenase [ubiquinone] 1 alpha subcomplex subunit 1 [Gracilariopsis chorda]|eukprot:PXF47149.1 NADH dehydrogenase [ubiquinone] 1 alpha subcomplex subunit 1 [Gracilariopsis chorda]
MAWYEAMPPLVIITAALGAMGSLQALVHRAFNDGKNKKVQQDHFNHLMDKRDERIKEEEANATSS